MLAAAVLASAAVFHGTPVPPAETPWLATLDAGGAFCGGALIAPDRVMTAAHCVQGNSPRLYRVVVNGHRYTPRGAYFPANYRVIPPPAAPLVESASASVDDIAIVVLRRPVTGVAPLALAATPPADGEATLTVGHGQTAPDSDSSRVALAAYQQVQPSATCLGLYGAKLFHPDLHLCTKDPTATGAQACPGDSGSAVMVRRDGVLQAAAVVTWGGETQRKACGQGPADV